MSSVAVRHRPFVAVHRGPFVAVRRRSDLHALSHCLHLLVYLPKYEDWQEREAQPIALGCDFLRLRLAPGQSPNLSLLLSFIFSHRSAKILYLFHRFFSRTKIRFCFKKLYYANNKLNVFGFR
ncbi:hypothetical protein I3842_05G045800 [Carya illinoinensis]|uniref:Uncharacterized protein n=1 Tax=Carya illinoinensis TaxID=32201 RepID=A0A922EZ33_CARIL|nr:hypothetical protein I3842_05G045800 [Carya illinoinensis]